MGQGKDFTWAVTKLLYSKLAVDQGWRGASMRVAAGGRGGRWGWSGSQSFATTEVIENRLNII